MGRKKGGKTITFRLVPAPAGSGENVSLERVFKPGSDEGRLSDDLLKSMDPALFGIHHSVSDDKIREICQSVYGISEIPTALKERLDRERAAAAEVRRTRNEKLQTHTEEQLENELTYFPLDGYDYEQHLAPIKGSIIPAPQVDPAEYDRPLPPKPVPELLNQPAVDAPLIEYLTPEEKEILAALEEQSGEEEGIDDDFVIQAGGVDLLEGNDSQTIEARRELLWGGWKPEIPLPEDFGMKTEAFFNSRSLEADFDVEEFEEEDDDEEEEEEYHPEELVDEAELADLLNDFDDAELGALDANDVRLKSGCVPVTDMEKEYQLFAPQADHLPLHVIYDDPNAGLPPPPDGMDFRQKEAMKEHIEIITTAIDSETASKIVHLSGIVEEDDNIDEVIEKMRSEPKKKVDCEMASTRKPKVARNLPQVIEVPKLAKRRPKK